jgi:hypothetical protein
MAEHTLTDLLQRVARRANLRNNGAHILRHTFCSHLAMRGAPVRAIQELAGHRDLSTTQRYMHLSPNAIDDAIRLLDLALQARSGVETSLTTALMSRHTNRLSAAGAGSHLLEPAEASRLGDRD